jgi:oxygen-independent coproporphyrinogen-3 oxidase
VNPHGVKVMNEDLLADARAVASKRRDLLLEIGRAGRANSQQRPTLIFPPENELSTPSRSFYGVDRLKPPATLYLHIPFSARELVYHGVSSYPVNDTDSRIRSYLDALGRELRQLRAYNGGRRIPLESAYVGGGTPTILSRRDLETVFEIVEANFELKSGGEYSLQCTADSVTAEKLQAAKAHGVTRLAVGAETFDDGLLDSLARPYRSEQLRDAISLIGRSGIRRVHVDLTAGLPGSSFATMLSDLSGVEGTTVDSVTRYGEAMLDLGELSRADAATEARLEEQIAFALGMSRLGYTSERLMGEWYFRDESSLFQQQIQKWRYRHNLIAAGQGVHGYIDGTTFVNFRDNERYARAIASGEMPIAVAHTLDARGVMLRNVLLGLKVGIDRDVFELTYGVDILATRIGPSLKRFLADDLMRVDGRFLKLTDMGGLCLGYLQNDLRSVDAAG